LRVNRQFREFVLRSILFSAAFTGALTLTRFSRLAKRMTILAQSRRIVVCLIWMTGVTNVALCDAPLMGNMADGAVRRGMGRLQMKFRAGWMA
jgi:hypothetical protein